MERHRDDHDNDDYDQQIEGEPHFNEERLSLRSLHHGHSSSISEVFTPNHASDHLSSINTASSSSPSYSPIQILPANSDPQNSHSPLTVVPTPLPDTAIDMQPSPRSPHSPTNDPLLPEPVLTEAVLALAVPVSSHNSPSSVSTNIVTGSYIIHVRTITGKTVSLTVLPTDTIASVKAQLSVTPGIQVPADQQRLIYSGRELQDDRVLSAEPNPILDGCTIHVVLRPRVPTFVTSNFEMPDAPGSFPLPNLNVRVVENVEPLEPIQGVRLERIRGGYDSHVINMNVERSSMNIRGVGTTFLVVGGVDLVLGSGDKEWSAIVLAVLLLMLGVMAISAGVARTTAAAKRYLGGIVFYVIAFVVIEFVVLFAQNDASRTNIASAVFVSIVLPIALCSVCIYCARMHVRNCQERDALVNVSVHVPIGPQGVASITRARHIQ